MPLESGTYVGDLVTSNPPGTDAKSQGDDHLRLIKSVLKTTFPNASRAFRFESVLSKSAAYNIAAADDRAYILADATSAGFTLTLPSGASVYAGFSVTVIKADSSTNVVTLDGNGAETINGAATLALGTQYQMTQLFWNGTEWSAQALSIVAVASSVDNRIVRFDGTTGRLVQLSALGIDDSGNIVDSNGNEIVKFVVTGSAVNEVTITNAASGNAAVIQATGGDTNVSLKLLGQGTGGVELGDGAAATPSLRFANSITTGLYRIGANILGFAANGAEVMRILDKAVKFARQVLFEVEAVTYSAAFNLDMSTQAVKKFTSSATAATATLTNIAAGERIECHITCNSASASLAWSGVTKWVGGGAPTLSQTVGVVDVILVWVMDDGSTVVGEYVGAAS